MRDTKLSRRRLLTLGGATLAAGTLGGAAYGASPGRLLQSVGPAYAQQWISRFGFDPELLFIMSRQGLKIREVSMQPVPPLVMTTAPLAGWVTKSRPDKIPTLPR